MPDRPYTSLRVLFADQPKPQGGNESTNKTPLLRPGESETRRSRDLEGGIQAPDKKPLSRRCCTCDRSSIFTVAGGIIGLAGAIVSITAFIKQEAPVSSIVFIQSLAS